MRQRKEEMGSDKSLWEKHVTFSTTSSSRLKEPRAKGIAGTGGLSQMSDTGQSAIAAGIQS